MTSVTFGFGLFLVANSKFEFVGQSTPTQEAR